MSLYDAEFMALLQKSSQQWNQGKLFPGGLLGANCIKDVHGPLPFVEMMPSGGV